MSSDKFVYLKFRTFKVTQTETLKQIKNKKMGFGFNLGMILIILPLSGLLLIIWLITKKQYFGKYLVEFGD